MEVLFLVLLAASALTDIIHLGKTLGSFPMRLMLIGKTGTGKSTLGNAILGKPTFNTAGNSMDSTTVKCTIGSAVIGDKNIEILDTPGVMGTSQDEVQIMKELFKGAISLEPGPHVFLLVIKADAKFNKEETEAVEIFSNVFGEAMYKHLIVVFTHKSALDKSNKIEDCLLKLPETFQQLKECCIAIETGGKTKQVKKEVQKLLQVVEMVIQRNKGGFYPKEKIKEIEKEYMARIEAKQGLRAKGKEQVQEIVGVAYETVADALIGVKDMVAGNMAAGIERVKGFLG